MPSARAIALVALLTCFFLMPKARSAAAQTAHTFEKTVTRTLGYHYLLSLPRDLAASPGKRWPLLLFLHGAGERGDDVWTVAKHGPTKLLRGAELSPAERAAAGILRTQFIVVSPQCPQNQWWDSATLLALLDELEATQPVDPRRVYLTGLSMGGYGTWSLGLGHPDRFAALVPICGGGDLPTVYVANATKPADLRRLPIRAFHGARDATVPLAESQRMVDMLRRMEITNVQLTVYPEAKHDSWTETYADSALYDWLLAQTR